MIERIIYSFFYRINKINRIQIIGNNNKIDRSRLIGCCVEITGNNNSIIISKQALIRNTKIFIKGNNCKIEIGENVSIKGGEIWLEDNNTSLIINAGTTIESAHLAVTEDFSKIHIGENCMFANNVEIRTGDSHAIFDGNQIRINAASSVSIGNNVWLGSRAMILKGVSIADNCLIGAGSIVTKNIEIPNSLSVGSPSKIVKEEINWTRERK